MEKSKILTVLYTVPQAACDSEKMNWQDVAALVQNQLTTVFQEKVSFEHIEFMSQAWFDDIHSRAQALLETGQVNFPVVLVNDELACTGEKVNISKIRRFIQSKLQ